MTDLTTHPSPASDPSSMRSQDLSAATSDDLGALLEAVAQELSRRSDHAARSALTAGVNEVGSAIGRSWAWQPAPDDRGRSHSALSYPAARQPSGTYERRLTMWGIREDRPGPQWKALLDATWPAYRAWYLSEGESARPNLRVCAEQLAAHMPELVPTWERMIALGGGDDLLARFLTGWDLPQFAPGCSQAVLTGDRPVLVRNYDYNADLFERVSLSTRLSGHKVIGTSDCLWGLLDGMNDAGLVVSLAFGGRPGSGEGFAVPMVVRYLLETCATVEQARAKLDTIPMAMTYNLTIADATGEALTAFVAPDAAPEYRPLPAATNHRGRNPEHPEHARALRSVERHDLLLDLIEGGIDRDRLADAFMAAPVRAENFTGGFGTLYTAIYRPDEGSVEYRWPDGSFIRTFDDASAQTDFVLRSSDVA